MSPAARSRRGDGPHLLGCLSAEPIIDHFRALGVSTSTARPASDADLAQLATDDRRWHDAVTALLAARHGGVPPVTVGPSEPVALRLAL